MSKKRPLINREISWLAFNERVLNEAADPTVPIMERIKFLGIFSNNRDEFFRVRVASLKRLAALNEPMEESNDDPRDVMFKLQQITLKQQQRYESIYASLLKDLEQEDVFLVNEQQLSPHQSAFIEKYFLDKVDPIVGPVMLDQVKHFPELRDKAIYLAAVLTLPNQKKKASKRYALIEVPSTLPRFVPIPDDDGRRYIIMLDDVIRLNLKEVFAVFKPTEVSAFTFKITRDAELDLDNDISKSFIEKMKKSLKARKKGAPVRFVFDSAMPDDLIKYLSKKMNLSTDDDAFIAGGRYHNLKDLMQFPKMPIPKAYYRPLPSHRNPEFDRYDSVFSSIAAKDRMLHFPYQTFNHLIDFLKEAALDPDVRTIRICLYRVDKQSKVVNALINAARNGKKVIVVFELQARFDEENNIYWANQLEDEGAKVYFGFPGLKVHGKICLITRKEGAQNVYYANISTGNFNETTSALYSDFSLFTRDPRITREVHKVFDLFESSFWPNYRFKHLILSPLHMRNRLVRLINQEIKNAKAGKPAYIHLKINNLVDVDLIQKLYDASSAGVSIRMVVRGICALVPGIKGVSDRIEVVSIVDRYLEHARCYVFCNGGEPLHFISSADWMVRNIDRRIEVTCPVYDPDLKQEIDEVLNLQFNDNVKARLLQPDGSYPLSKPVDKKDIRSQYELNEFYKKKSKNG